MADLSITNKSISWQKLQEKLKMRDE